MEVLDEKTNGALMPEIEDIVPVTNRMYHLYHGSPTAET